MPHQPLQITKRRTARVRLRASIESNAPVLVIAVRAASELQIGLTEATKKTESKDVHAMLHRRHAAERNTAEIAANELQHSLAKSRGCSMLTSTEKQTSKRKQRKVFVKSPLHRLRNPISIAEKDSPGSGIEPAAGRWRQTRNTTTKSLHFSRPRQTAEQLEDSEIAADNA